MVDESMVSCLWNFFVSRQAMVENGLSVNKVKPNGMC